MELNEGQLRAIEYEGRNLQLVACAGSGKTEVVSRRVVRPLDPQWPDALKPEEVVAFMFTEKAAAELKERIVTRSKEPLGEVTGIAQFYVGMIQAFCLKHLKTETARYFKYEVLNDVQQELFIDRHSRQSGPTTMRDFKGCALRRYRDRQNYRTALSILRKADVHHHALEGSSVVEGFEAYTTLLDKRLADDPLCGVAHQIAELVPTGWIRETNNRIDGHGGAFPDC